MTFGKLFSLFESILTAALARSVHSLFRLPRGACSSASKSLEINTVGTVLVRNTSLSCVTCFTDKYYREFSIHYTEQVDSTVPKMCVPVASGDTFVE